MLSTLWSYFVVCVPYLFALLCVSCICQTIESFHKTYMANMEKQTHVLTAIQKDIFNIRVTADVYEADHLEKLPHSEFID